MIKKAEILAALFVVLGLWTGSLQAGRIIYVDDDGPADFNNIQAAIDDANNGDTIIVADGIYTDFDSVGITVYGKSITLRSENGPINCIIDCNATESNPRRGFSFLSGEDSILDGFTIINGIAPQQLFPLVLSAVLAEQFFVRIQAQQLETVLLVATQAWVRVAVGYTVIIAT